MNCESECLSAVDRFREVFGHGATRYAFAPGRYQILGDHTDYCQGLSLTGLTSSGIVAVITITSDPVIRIFSEQYGSVTVTREDVWPMKIDHDKRWSIYLVATAWKLLVSRKIEGGVNIYVSSGIRGGGGVSSSMAIMVATFFAMTGEEVVTGEESFWDAVYAFKEIDNELVGVPTGLLDQVAIIAGQQGALTYYDVDRHIVKSVSFELDCYEFVLVDSDIHHDLLAGSGYKERVQDSLKALDGLNKSMSGDVPRSNLSHFSIPEILEASGDISLTDLRRSMHIAGENNRVMAAVGAIGMNDIKRLGDLMNENFLSCRYSLENTVPEINFLWNEIVKIDECLGAKVSGAGWGGSILCLIHKDHINSHLTEVGKRYQEMCGHSISYQLLGPGAELRFGEI